MRFASIVEGHGEVDAVRVLVRRIAQEGGIHHVHILTPIRVPRGHFHPGSTRLEHAVRLAAYQVAGSGALMVLFDADDDCPAQLGPSLQAYLTQLVPHVPSAVVLAHREFETWFLAALESLRNVRGIRPDAVTPADPESIRSAKEYLRNLVDPSRQYRETVDQAALASRMDLATARSRSASFDKFCREVLRLLSTGSAGPE